MRRFEPGEVATSKDFCGRDDMGASDIGDLIVIRHGGNHVVFRDEQDEEFALPLHKAREFEWCFHRPATMVRPK